LVGGWRAWNAPGSQRRGARRAFSHPAGWARAVWISRSVSVKQCGFEQGDAVEAAGSVGELLDELRFGWSGGMVFVEAAAAMVLISGGGFGGRTAEAAIMPWRKALSDERWLPAGYEDR
jgi:hypothetical protein